MKPAALICFLFFALAVSGQETHPFDRSFRSLVLYPHDYVYSNNNAQGFFQKARALMELGDPDSSDKAVHIIHGLYFFDSVAYAYESLEPMLQEIRNRNSIYYGNALSGCWRFKSDFNTGLVSEVITTTDKDTLNSVRFDGCTARFYFADSLERTTPYIIEPVFSGFATNRFRIHFEDRNENWYFSLKNNTLTVYLDPSCLCGCVEHIYRKVNPDLHH